MSKASLPSLLLLALFFGTGQVPAKIPPGFEVCEDKLVQQKDFNIRVGDVALAPSVRQIRFNSRVIRLAPQEYAMFEAIVLGEGAIVALAELSDEAARSSSFKDAGERLYGENWVAQYYVRLRDSLREAYGAEFSERLVRHHGRGISWNTEHVLKSLPTFPEGKLTYVKKLDRMFVGRREVLIGNKKRGWILKTIVGAGGRGVGFENLSARWLAEFGEPTNIPALAQQISRSNATVAEFGYSSGAPLIGAVYQAAERTYAADPAGINVVVDL